MMVNYPLSKEIAAKVGSQAKTCWLNAFRGLDHLPGALYIEGWAITADGLIIEHGWLDLDGVIIDPTLHDPSNPVTYYPGIRLTSKELQTAILKTKGELPIYWSMISTGGHPDYKAAFDQAVKDSKSRERRTT